MPRAPAHSISAFSIFWDSLRPLFCGGSFTFPSARAINQEIFSAAYSFANRLTARAAAPILPLVLSAGPCNFRAGIKTLSSNLRAVKLSLLLLSAVRCKSAQDKADRLGRCNYGIINSNRPSLISSTCSDKTWMWSSRSGFYSGSTVFKHYEV